MKNYALYTTNSRTGVDLSVFNCGWQNCYGSHSFGPRITNYFLIHFLLGGKGIFTVGGKEHTIEKGQAFLIYPSDYALYRADPDDPYEYLWVGFHGVNASGIIEKTSFSRERPVIAIADMDKIVAILKQIIACSSFYTEEKNLESLGHLYILLSALISQNNAKPNGTNSVSAYIVKAIQYIHENYHTNITMSDLCGLVSLNCAYFSTIFKKHMDISPYDYLINYRIDQACKLLVKTSHPVSEISSMVGFRDPINFSLRFKKIIGLSPSAYRKSNYDNDVEIPV